MERIQEMIHYYYPNEPQRLQAFATCNYDVNLVDEHGKTLLHLASDAGHTDYVQALIDLGADIHIRDPWEADAAYRAAVNGHFHALELLLNAGAKFQPDDNSHHIDLVSSLIFEVNYSSSTLNRFDDYVKTIELLIQRGININHINANGETPLMYAAYCEDPTIPLLLLKNGADPSIQYKGMTASEMGTGVVAQIIRSFKEHDSLHTLIGEDPAQYTELTLDF